MVGSPARCVADGPIPFPGRDREWRVPLAIHEWNCQQTVKNLKSGSSLIFERGLMHGCCSWNQSLAVGRNKTGAGSQHTICQIPYRQLSHFGMLDTLDDKASDLNVFLPA